MYQDANAASWLSVLTNMLQVPGRKYSKNPQTVKQRQGLGGNCSRPIGRVSMPNSKEEMIHINLLKCRRTTLGKIIGDPRAKIHPTDPHI